MILTTADMLIRLGIPVLPVWGVRDDGSCRCPRGKDCKNKPGKHPLSKLVSNGVKNATLDMQTVRAWHTLHPTMNLGARCGDQLKDGRYLVVLDVDPRNGGDESLLDLGELPKTLSTCTPTRGQHAYYGSQLPIAKGCAGLGLDVQGVGTYVVAPGSRHMNGGLYDWDSGMHPNDGIHIADAPAVLVGRRARPRKVQPGDGDAADTWMGEAFAAAGWLGDVKSDGSAIRMVRCPWAHEHSDDRGRGSDDSTVILAPAKGYGRTGTFSCAHGHCRGRTLREVLDVLPPLAKAAVDPRHETAGIYLHQCAGSRS